MGTMASSGSEISLSERIYRSLKRKKKIRCNILLEEFLSSSKEELLSSSKECEASSTLRGRNRKSNLSERCRKMVTNSLMEGILWQKTNSFSSRWKERFCVLTKFRLTFFQKCVQDYPDFDPGFFLSEIKITNILKMELASDSIYQTLVLTMTNSKQMLFRCKGSMQQWHNIMKALHSSLPPSSDMLKGV